MASSATLSGGSSTRSSSRIITIGLLAIASGFAARFIWHYAAPYFMHFDVKQFEGYWPHRFRLITHIGGGILALICGTFQLWTGLRMKAMNVHRWIGRVYLVGAAVGITGAFLMAVYSQPRSVGVGLMGLASAWILTTGVAWAAILRGQVELHKEWMMRSYIVAFGFVTFRFITDMMPGINARLGSNPGDSATSVAWMCWVLPLAVYEVILQMKRLRAPA